MLLKAIIFIFLVGLAPALALPAPTAVTTTAALRLGFVSPKTGSVGDKALAAPAAPTPTTTVTLFMTRQDVGTTTPGQASLPVHTVTTTLAEYIQLWRNLPASGTTPVTVLTSPAAVIEYFWDGTKAASVPATYTNANAIALCC
ncbi:hypothetical protein LTR36_009934 [Oleoguttula mirabilis]|uniref:Uncharacterized protein n=1 Tax=Oleoguttula mirabilis TaxID=1507867 RepID=A0AAV9J4R7_9PEZI|nr:hypothetical protein LTR36_009934 [Oleoguttula mirabilis]